MDKNLKEIVLNGYSTFEEASKDSKYTSKTEALLQMLRGDNCFISGPAGSGKSYLISMFIKAMSIIEPEKNITLTSTTGLSAINIGGMTIHKFIGFLGNKTFEECSEDSKCKYGYWKISRDLIKNTDILVIDEVSMLSKRHLDFILKRLQLENKSNMQVVVLGDFSQLPPVNASKLEKDKDAGELCYGTSPWKEFGFKDIYLDKIYRTSDVNLSKLLDNIALGRGDSEESKRILNLIKSQITSAVDKETSVLMSTNRAVDTYNESEQNKNTHVLYRFNTLYGARKVDFKLAKKEDLDFAKEGNVPEFIQLKTGDTVMVTSNQVSYSESEEIKSGLSLIPPLQNGSIGVLSITKKKGGEPQLNLKVGDIVYSDIKQLTTYQTEKVKRKEIQLSMAAFIAEKKLSKEEYLEDPKKFIDKYWKSLDWRIKSGSVKKNELYPRVEEEEKIIAQFTQYPIKLAYAISIHKSQGQTFNKVAVDMNSMWMENLGYVALSRARSLNGITFINKRYANIPKMALSVNQRSLEIKESLFKNAAESKTSLYSELKEYFEDLIKNFEMSNETENNLIEDVKENTEEIKSEVIEEKQKEELPKKDSVADRISQLYDKAEQTSLEIESRANLARKNRLTAISLIADSEKTSNELVKEILKIIEDRNGKINM